MSAIVHIRIRTDGHLVFFFFFQAEDGIRDVAVTGVQTCALPIYSCAERGRYADQLFVKQCYRRPVGPASMCTLSMYRLNCSFELKPAGAPALETLGEMTFRLFD